MKQLIKILRIIVKKMFKPNFKQMKNIQGIKVGTTVNVSIDGKLTKKICGSIDEANELFRMVLKAKENPTDEAVKMLRSFLNEKTRIAMLAGLETDPDSGEVFLAGFNTPVPLTLVEVVKEYHDNGFPIEAIINFWKLLMINLIKGYVKACLTSLQPMILS